MKRIKHLFSARDLILTSHTALFLLLFRLCSQLTLFNSSCWLHYNFTQLFFAVCLPAFHFLTNCSLSLSLVQTRFSSNIFLLVCKVRFKSSYCTYSSPSTFFYTSSFLNANSPAMLMPPALENLSKSIFFCMK